MLSHKTVNNRKIREYGKVPSKHAYSIIVRLLKLVMTPWLHITWDVDPVIFKLSKPILVIGNHPSYFDPFLAGLAVFPLQVNFLAADNYFRKPWMRWILYNLGVIPKIQFRADAVAMKAMLRVVKRGGVLGIFPEGTRSIHGRLMPVEDTFTKFIKRIEANVISVRIQGGYMTWPRWSKSGKRVGRIVVSVRCVAESSEVRDCSLESLKEMIIGALSYDDYAMQAASPTVYRSDKPALGLHNILHQCPKCAAMWAMRSTATSLACSACGNTAVMDRYGFLRAQDDSSLVFETVFDWNKWQIDYMKPLAASADFTLSDTAVMEISDKEMAFAPSGRGTISLYTDRFEFVPESGSTASETVRFPIIGLRGISSEYGRYFDLIGEKQTYRFILDNGQKAIAFSHALDILRSI